MASLLAHPDYTRERVRQVARLAGALVHADARPPEGVRIAGPAGRITVAEAAGLAYHDATPGMALGPLWATWWLAVQARVPVEWDAEQVDLLLVTNSEATLWLDGEPVQGLVSGGEHVRAAAMLAQRAVAGESLSATVEIACNGLFGWSDLHPQPQHVEPPAAPFRLERCELARFDRDAWALSCDLDVLVALMDDPRTDDAWRGELLRELNRFCNAWDAEDRGTWPAARAILAALLERRNATRTHEITAIGHAHIDTAWLWPLEETLRKCVRTFATQLRLMVRYPGYRFACSQAQQYAWIRDRAPGLWARIRDRVAAGQWLPVGGTWVEPDCNLPAGESLVRQFLYGQRFFEHEFGRRARVFWNPDVFGYNGQLPQIMRGAGIDGFLTQKLSWNRFNPPEHHTFRWVGIDGSAVLAHFPPADTYNAEATVPELRRAARDFKDHALSTRSLLVFGWGDGGGGPTAQMLETLVRVEDLQGVPRTTIGDPEAFFARLADEADWPEVVGELYLEYHRGTYTTQARTKRASRRAERALHDAELLAAVADAPWPREELDRAWQTLLLNHFHDILPGSSIGEVHARAERDLAEVQATAGAIRDRLAAGEVINTVGVERREVVSTPGGLAFAKAPPCGVGRLVEAPGEVRVDEDADGFVLDNGRLRAVLGREGALRSLLEPSSGREAMAAPGNVLELYEDRPTDFEAWDLDPFHLETRSDCPGASGAEVVLAGPLRGEVAFERAIGARSRMRQTVRLDAESARLEFHCAIDWHEDRRALKVRFPVAVHAPRATYEMQFGVVERPTHYSTRRDLAQFEVPAHRFADLAEHGFGVALLSAATYGWSVHGGDMGMTLLRSPRWPDPDADVGHHELAFAILPHPGGWQEAGVTAQAMCFNAPLLLGERGGKEGSWFSTDAPGLLIDTVKRAEDGDALIIRLYEAHGGRGTARLRVGIPFAEAWFTNLLEERLAPAEVDGEAVVIPFRPFEIVTVALGPP
ncbi:MAG TPA: glycoside hydrolase family 38 C-terminal domain-containing protein [Solirubrobacteraceae bacterium]|nr:glycoside hydrolase family 38 C-terminal domain-containing protein [Solirubrobacteraceae bacterium]